MARNIRFNPDDLTGRLGGLPIEETAKEPERKAKEPKAEVRAEEKSTSKVAGEPAPSKKEEPKPEKEVLKAAGPMDDKEIIAQIRDEHGRFRGNKQGKKINYVHVSMGDDLFDYINTESVRRGLPRQIFVNYILKKYMDSPEGHVKLS